MNEEQYKSLTKEQQQELAEHSHADCEKYHERCDDNCDEMHPDKCKALVKQSRACQYKVISTLLSDESNAMIGIAYWTKLIDGGSAWIIHPIDCDSATVERGTDHDTLTAHTHVYNKQMKFDMDLIQFVEYGPSYINEFEETTQRILKGLKDTIFFDEVRLEGNPFGQVEELVYSVRWSRDGLSNFVKIRLIGIFSEVLFYDDIMDIAPGEDTLKRYRENWLDCIKHNCSRAKHVLEQERITLDPDQDNTDTIDEIELISGMIDAIPEEYKDILKSCPNIVEIIKTWPPLLLPHPEVDLLNFASKATISLE